MSNYAAAINTAGTAHELNTLADAIARDDTIAADERHLLQLAYAHRCRELWPRQLGGPFSSRRSGPYPRSRV